MSKRRPLSTRVDELLDWAEAEPARPFADREWTALRADVDDLMDRLDEATGEIGLAAAPPHLPPHLAPIWCEMVEQVDPDIGAAGLEALVVQVYRMRDAEARITAEGLVTADAKGNPVAHPALAVEKQAQGEVRAWLAKYGGQRAAF